MATEKSEDQAVQEAIDEVLRQIIDEWYENVSPHYITQEEGSSASQKSEEELKRFHDETGHRIKFNKEDLDFTYGLRSHWGGNTHYVIEISVNNKVEHFDYDDFQRRLVSHYRKTRTKSVPTPYELKNSSYGEIFQLQPSLQEAFTVEEREGKADIMRLSFRVNRNFIQNLASHPISSKQLIEDYCVSPFRKVYATVYRRQSR